MKERRPKVVIEAFPEELQPGDFSVELGGTFIVDPDGSWRGYNNLTQAEKTLCLTIIRAQHAEEALEPFAQAARAHGMRSVSGQKGDLHVSLSVPASAWLWAMELLSR